MADSRIDALNYAIDNAVADREWIESASRIADERSQIDAALEAGSLGPVYGFTTLLGQLDTADTFDLAQKALLESHLIGRLEWLPEEWFRAISAVKLEQLSRGGSGLSPAAFAALLDGFGREGGARGAWWDSYGCGDVVPGAWWASIALDEKARENLRPGDLIALINGHFVAAASLLMAGRELEQLVESSLPLVESVLSGTEAVDRNPHLQIPVSGRPPQHAVALGRSTVASLYSTVEGALQSFSGNPIFEFSSTDLTGEVTARSVSLFLNFDSAVRVSSALQSVKLISALATRAISRECERKLAESEGVAKLRFIQPPKVAAAIHAELCAASSGRSAAFIHESEGLEDIADGALSASRDLHGALSRLRSLTDLLHAAVGGWPLTVSYERREPSGCQ